MAATDMTTEFVGRRGRLFRLSIWTGLLTVLTLGVYRFWMKTRLRRYYWSSIRPGGHPLEYVGDPLEKLLGFLIAVVILAFYIGIVNLALMFVSFSVFEGNTAAYVASVAGVVPIWFYARYRARRYVYARTRWRGIRFGVDPGAWGYAWRALFYWALTILSGTLLWPLMTHRLEKYKWDRTWFGDRRFHQGGTARMLIWGAVPTWIVLGLLAAAIAKAIHGGGNSDPLVSAFLIVPPLLLPAYAFYAVRSFRKLTEAKSAGGIAFRSRARTPRVTGIYVLGYTLTFVLTAAFAAMVIFAGLFLLFAWEGMGFSLDDFDDLPFDTPGLGLQILGLVAYFLTFIVWAALRHVFVTLPLWRHYAATIEILNTAGVAGIGQRVRDEHREAEGFAEALDLGAAI